MPLPPVGVSTKSRGTTLNAAGNAAGVDLARLKSSCVGAVPELIVIVLLGLPNARDTPPRSVRRTVPRTSAAPADVPLCCRIAPDATVRSVVSVNAPATDASTVPVPLLTVTPFALLIVRLLKDLEPS